MTTILHCECGVVTGDRCPWSGPVEQTCVLEYRERRVFVALDCALDLLAFGWAGLAMAGPFRIPPQSEVRP
jgi:hypothetical protein